MIAAQPRTRSGLTLALFTVLIAAWTQAARAQAIAPSSAPATPQRQEIVAPFFLSGPRYKSELAIQNLRIDVPIAVRPSLYVDGHEITLDSVTIGPKAMAHVDITAALLSKGVRATLGAAVVRYDFRTTGAIAATVESEDEDHGVALTIAANGREEFMGTRLDAVVWAPPHVNDGFVAIVNAAAEPRRAHITYLLPNRQRTFEQVEIAPRQVYSLNLKSLLAHSHTAGAGICIAFAGAPGDLQAEGALIEPRTRFAKRIHFVDSTLHFGDGSLRSNFALLGTQPSAPGFPASIAFRSVVAIRNLNPNRNVTVTPYLKYATDASAPHTHQTVRLNDVLLGPQASSIIDLTDAQHEGRIPPLVHQAFVELRARVSPTRPPLNAAAQESEIVAELFNYDEQTLGYVVGPSFTAHQARAVTSDWRTDGTFDTAIAIDNASARDDDVSIRLIAETGVVYRQSIHMEPGSVTRISVKKWQEDGVRDLDGRQLDAQAGTLVIEGARGTQSALVLERMIHSEDEAYYVGPGPCDYITGIDGFLTGDSNPFTALIDCYWNTGVETQQGADRYSTNNSGFIQISSNQVTFSTAEEDASGNLTFNLDFTTGCSACSYASYESTLSFSKKLSAYLLYEPSNCFYVPNGTNCPGQCSNDHYVLGGCGPDGFKQCLDILLNGQCFVRRLVCASRTMRGYCT